MRNKRSSVKPAVDADAGDERARENEKPQPEQRRGAAVKPLRTVVEGQDWRTFSRSFLTDADMDFLEALGALDEDGKRICTIRMSADVRTRFSHVVLDRLVAFGVFSFIDGPEVKR